jgi:hypothetical protein
MINDKPVSRLSAAEETRRNVLSFIVQAPGCEVGQIGVALAPSGHPRTRAWAMKQVADLSGLIESRNPVDGSIRFWITTAGRREQRRLAARPNAVTAGRIDAHVDDNPAKALQRRAAPPWIAMAADGRITARQEDAANDLSDAISAASTDGKQWLSEQVDRTPDHGAAQIAAIQRAMIVSRLTSGLDGDQAQAVAHVVVHERTISNIIIDGIRAKDSRPVMRAALAALRDGLERVAVNAGILHPARISDVSARGAGEGQVGGWARQAPHWAATPTHARYYSMRKRRPR